MGSPLTNLKFYARKVFSENILAIVISCLKVDIQDIAVTGLSECCSNFKQVLVVTSHTLTVHPAALKAMGKARRTPVTGPEWPVKVQTGVDGEPEIYHDLVRLLQGCQ